MKISNTFTKTMLFLEERVKFANAQTHYAETSPSSADPGSYYTNHWTTFKKEKRTRKTDPSEPKFYGSYYTNHHYSQ